MITNLPLWLAQFSPLSVGGKILLLLLLGMLAYRLAHRASAAERNFILIATLSCALIVPILHPLLPHWRVPIHRTIAPMEPQYLVTHTGIKRLTPSPVTKEKLPPTMPSQEPIPSTVPQYPPASLPETLFAYWSFMWPLAIRSVWLVGVIFIGIRLLYSIWKTSYLIYDRCDIDITNLGLPKIPEYVTVVWNPNISTPMTLGIFHSILLLPASAATWPPEQLRAVVLHELAHIERKDCLTQIFAQIVCAIFWYNPFVWWVARKMQAEAENACDDRVLSQGISATDYAEHLVHLAKSIRVLKFGPSVVAMASHSKISDRVTAILDKTRSRHDVKREVFLKTLGASVPIVILLAVFTPMLWIDMGSQVAFTQPTTNALDQRITNSARFDVNPNSLWTRRLANGTLAELVSVSGHDPKTGSRATWSPDGAPLSWSRSTTSYLVDHITVHLKFPSMAIERATQATFGLTEQPPYALDWVGNGSLNGMTEITDPLPNSAKATDAVLVIKPMTVLGYRSAGRSNDMPVYGGMLHIGNPKRRVFVNGFGQHRPVLDVDVTLPKLYTDGSQYEDWLDVINSSQPNATSIASGFMLLKRDLKTATLRFTFRDPDSALAPGTEFRCYVRQRHVIRFSGIALKPHFTQALITRSESHIIPKAYRYTATWHHVPGTPEVTEAVMHQIYGYIQTYRANHQGAYPNDRALFNEMVSRPGDYGIVIPNGSDPNKIVDVLFRATDTKYLAGSLQTTSRFLIRDTRLDGTLLGGPKATGTRDVLTTTALYVMQNWKDGITTTQIGFYLVLWDDGTVTRVPWDQVLYVPMGSIASVTMPHDKVIELFQSHEVDSWTYGMPGEAGLPPNFITCREFYDKVRSGPH